MAMVVNQLFAYMNRHLKQINQGSFLLIIFILSTNLLFGQATIVEWNFDDSDNMADGGLLVNQNKVVTSESRANFAFFTGFSGQSISLNNWTSGQNSKYWMVEFETTGYDNLTLSSRQRSSERGPADFKLEYSLNGTDWTEIAGGAITVGLDWTTGAVIDFSLPIALNDQGSVYIRWIMTSDNAVVTNPILPAGTSRMDDIIVTGFPIAGAPTVAISSSSPAAGTIDAGSINNELYRLDFGVSNNDATLTSVTFIPGGTYDALDLDSFSLWYSSDDSFDDQLDELLGTEPPVPSGSNLAFTGLSKTTIAGNTGYFFLTVNVDQNAYSNTISIHSTDFNNIIFNPPSIKTGTNPAIAGNTQTIRCFDTDSDVFSLNQPPANEILSTATDASQAVKVFELYIYDQGNCDGLPTYVTNIRLKKYSSNTANWPTSIGGIILRDQGNNQIVPNTSLSVFDDYLDISIPSGDLTIPDQDSKTIEVEVYLTDLNPLIDQSILSFFVEYNDHGFLADTQAGSGFIDEFFIGADFYSNDFTINVEASQLLFLSSNQPIATEVNQPMAIDVIVEGTDIYENRDIEFTNTVELTSSGSLLNSPVQSDAVDGLAVFSGITHTSVGTNIQLTANSSGVTSASSNLFDILVVDQDFTNCPPSGWTSVLISGNSWNCGSGYASVSGIGGSSPTQAWYLMPTIDFSTLSNAVLSFDSWTSGTDDLHPKLEVLYSTEYPGSGNPNLYNWNTLIFNLPSENSQTWTASGTIDLSTVVSSAYIAFKYTSSGTVATEATEWRIDNVSVTENGCLAPDISSSNLTFSNIASTSMTLNWDAGNGTGRIVIAKEGSAVDQVPVDGTTYTANSDFTAGEDIGGGNIVVYLGNSNSVDVTVLSENTEYFYAVYEYNCDAATPVFNSSSPVTGNQATADPNASDIIVNSGFLYPVDFAYSDYQALSTSMSTSNSISVMGLTLRDGGSAVANDGLPTTLTSISFNTNGSNAIRAAAIYYGSNLIDTINVNGSTDFTFDLTSNPIVADDTPPPSKTSDFELWVTFERGSHIMDNEQLVFTVTDAVADGSGTGFTDPDAGGATSDATGNENVIQVDATSLNFIQVPISTIIVDSPFTIEVEAIDDLGSADLDKVLDISVFQGSGTLYSASGLQRATLNGTAIWDDLNYNAEETDVQFQIADNPIALTPITTNLLKAKAGLSVFTFTGANGDEAEFSPDFQPNNLTIGNIKRGSDLDPNNYSDAFNASGWSQASQPEDNYFYEFTITADDGYDFSISSIELDHRRSNTGPPLWVVRSSVDDFTSNIDKFFSTPTDGTWYTNEEIDFTGSVTDAADVTIRLYAYNAGGPLGTWTIDNLYIFGSTRDIQAPEFTSGYPLIDSLAVDGFDLTVNLTEAGTVYYIVQDPSIVPTAPEVSDVVLGQNGNGLPAEASGTIDVTSSATDFIERVGGLNAQSVYDVYYVLFDGTNYSLTPIAQLGVLTTDVTSLLATTTQPAAPYEIPSLATDAGSAVNVFNFLISDEGTADSEPTYVTKLVFNLGSNGTITDWSTIIAGASLYNVTDGMSIPITATTITSTALEIDINPGDLSVINPISEEIALSIWLTNVVPDNETIEFTIGGDPHINETYNIGSQLDPVQPLLASNIYNIDVEADRLTITLYDQSVNNSNSDISLFVEATDANLNIDLDEISDVQVVLGQGIGAISTKSGGPLTLPLVNGAIDWQDIRYDTNDEIITLIVNSLKSPTPLISDTTGTILVGSPTDLIVNTDFLLTSDLSVGNVIINDGASLTIGAGVILSVSGDYTFNGSGTLIDQGAITVFNGGANVTQTINKIPAGTPERFYNIEIDQGNNASLYNEMSIELINTLTMTQGTFYIDGSANDQEFTLVSTSSSTARIAEMADGTSIIGDIIWQRSLRTGPKGYRYFGTPIKNQTLANISDDIWIQGIAEIYPTAFTNISTYAEPVGTSGQNGFDGWVDYTSNSNDINVGVGNKLYLWANNYATEQVIINKGAPTIGDGGDGIAGSGETFDFNISFTSTSFDGGGWNFFANPYPCEIDWNNVDQTDLIGSAMYIWDPVDAAYKTYSIVSPGSSDMTEFLASGQGFFINALNGTTSALSFSESAKSTANNNSFMRISEELFPKMFVKVVSENGRKDETAIAFRDFASNQYEPLYDAIKFGGGWVNLSTKLDDKLIAINAMGESRGVQSVKLNIAPYIYGNYTMSFPAIESFSENAVIKLKDKYLDKTTYINSTTNYTFIIDENNPDTYGGDRFEIQFVEPAAFRFEKPSAKAGQELVVPIFGDKLADIMSTNMGLSWDSSALTFVGIDDTGDGTINNFDLSEVENGRLIFTDDRDNPLSLPDGSQLFSVRFMANNGIAQTQIQFERQRTSLKAIDDIDMPFDTEDVLIDILQNRFVNGEISTFTGEFVNEVKVTAQSADEQIENISDITGAYVLGTYEQSDYLISGSKTDNIPLNEIVTTLDIIKTRRHLLRLDEFNSPYQTIAADVNGSNSISALDLVEMRKVVLGINQNFQSGLDWLIIPEIYDLSNDPFNYQTGMNVSLTDQDVNLNFVGVKVGDVDNSWTNGGAARKSNIDFTLSMQNLSLSDDIIEIPIIVEEMSNIRGYQFSISWDPNKLEYYNTESGVVEGFYNDQLVGKGLLTTMWDEGHGNAVELAAGSKLFTLRFRAKNETAKSEVNVNSTITEAVAFDEKLNFMNISAKPVSVNLDELRNGHLELFQNIPNPFDYSTQIDFKIAKAGNVTLSIINTLGEIVYIHEQDYKAGIYSITWDRKQGKRAITPGVYLYRIESNGEEIVKKMMIK